MAEPIQFGDCLRRYGEEVARQHPKERDRMQPIDKCIDLADPRETSNTLAVILCFWGLGIESRGQQLRDAFHGVQQAVVIE